MHTECLIDTFVLQSAKTNLNVEQVFFSIARDIKQRLADTDSKAEVCPVSLVSWLSTKSLLGITLVLIY